MHREPSSAAWRLTALLLGASWVVTLAVACGGGGGDDVIANSVVATGATAAAGSGARAEAAAVAAAAPQPQVPGHNAVAMPAVPLQPCADASRRQAHLAAVPAHLRAPAVQGDELGDEALNSPAGRPGAGAAGAAPPANAFEAK